MPIVLALSKQFPANTTFANRLRDSRTVQRGWYLKEIRLHVPSGHAALTPVWFEAGDGNRIMPTDGNEIRLDNVPDLPLPTGYLFDRDTELALVGYNEDTALAHTTRALAIILVPGEEGYPSERR